MIGNLLGKLFGSRHDKIVKSMQPIVDEIDVHFKKLESLTDDEIKAKTIEFKEIIKDHTKELEDEKIEIRAKLKNESLDADEIQDLNDRIKKLKKEIFEEIEDILEDIMPEAFAVVKQVCKRLTENMHRYEYAGQPALWEMIPYDVQMIGGVSLHRGKISEMATGEGKTLVAVMPMYLNALPGKGVHLVTVNDYLAKRDSEWMSPVFDFLGITVGSIQSNMDHDRRKKIYNMDISYGTNNEFGFDYLRDNMVVEADQMVQREHWYAIVDEVDSVLVDEARTPLIISGPVGQSDQRFDELNPRVLKLVQNQNRLVNSFLADVPKLLEKIDDKEALAEAGVKILRSHRGLPKHKRLAKVLQEPSNQKLLKDTELEYLRDQGRRMNEIDEGLYYTIDEKNHGVDISDQGRDLLASAQEEAEMFIIPDIAAQLSEIEGDINMPDEEKQTKKDEIHRVFSDRSDRIHTISQLLRAHSLYEKDIEYVIQDKKVMIVDEHTGRILDGRRYSEGLHQAIEAKEHVKVEKDTQTFATITLQNYFRLYNKLAGMTGTAETEASEFEKIYKLETLVIPPNRPIVRDDMEDLIYKTKREKYNAVVDEVEEILKAGRAILVGTATVETSELLSKMMKRRGIKHNVLNAKQHEKEADIVSSAGKKGAVTIATNMAGRGTDIKLDHEVKKNGGLAILGSERHDSRRIDRQLRGRAGRQGDPGSSIFFISLEDRLMRLFGGERMAGVMSRLKIPEGEPIQHSMITKSVERAQKKVEENNFGVRKRLLEYDDVMNQQRTVIYARRRQALRGERLKGEIFEYVEDMADQWYEDYSPLNDMTAFKNEVRSKLLCDVNFGTDDIDKLSKSKAIEIVLAAATKFYERKEEMLGVEFMAKLERIAALETIDEKWRDHLRLMDDIKEGIHLRSYGQKNPILEYKGEAYRHFVELVGEINSETTTFAFKYFPRVVDRSGKEDLPASRRRQPQQMQFQHPSENPAFMSGSPQAPEAQAPETNAQTAVATFKRVEQKVKRNDPCPCGSGKKYKACCGKGV
ncbi:MAG: preprotein translocase subunit SecA [Chlorobi bacterium]|nr:preprotein translocase subunit SecA [Chlorobiota bacterium]